MDTNLARNDKYLPKIGSLDRHLKRGRDAGDDMTGRLGVLMIGANGSIATTMTAGVFALRAGLSDQHCMITEGPEFSHIALPSLSSLVFGGWDLHSDRRHVEAAMESAEVPSEIIRAVNGELEAVAVHHGISLGISDAVRESVKLDRESDRCALEAAQRIGREIASFIEMNGLDGAVVVNLASTEPPIASYAWQQSIVAFEAALAANNPDMPAGMIYAYAAMQAGCPVLNYTPSDVFEIPALIELAHQRRLPLAGRDGKTGQTFYKSVLAPALDARALNVDGWFSTNILGNGDGLTLSHAPNLVGKRRSKLQALEVILKKPMDHQVHIHHYAPRKQQKEAWDSVDLRGWLGAAVQMKINWIAPDSALAAPMVVDLVRLLWWAKNTNRVGVQSFLAAFFKDPLDCPVHGFAEQFRLLLAAVKPEPRADHG